MFVDGLSRLDKHGFATEPCRSSTIDVFVNKLFDQTIAQMPLLLAVNVGNTNAAVSTVVGEGVAKSIVGGDGAAEFVVTAKEFGTGRQRAASGDAVTVRVVPKEKGGSGGCGSGGGGGAAAKPVKGGKRKCGGGGGGAAVNTSKKSKTGAAASSSAGAAAAELNTVVGAVADTNDGRYNCSYTLPTGAEEKESGLEVLPNGEHVVGRLQDTHTRPRQGWRHPNLQLSGRCCWGAVNGGSSQL